MFAKIADLAIYNDLDESFRNKYVLLNQHRTD